MNEEFCPIRMMEPKILERLNLVFPKDKNFTVDSCPAIMDLETFNQLTRQTPYIGLNFTGLRTDANAGKILQAIWQWRLMIVCKAVGNYDRAIKGDVKGLGLYTILDVAATILHGVSFENIGLCQVVSSETIHSDGWHHHAYVLAHLNFEIRTTMTTGALALEELADFKSLGADWMLPDKPDIQENGEDDAQDD